MGHGKEAEGQGAGGRGENSPPLLPAPCSPLLPTPDSALPSIKNPSYDLGVEKIAPSELGKLVL